jgi:hypothetical protein
MSVLQTHMCPRCGVEYGLPEPYYKNKVRLGDSWSCPNGHSILWRVDPAEDLTKQVRDLQAKLEVAEKRIEALTAELDVWRPASVVKLLGAGP